jgi:predicted glycosyltransferase
MNFDECLIPDFVDPLQNLSGKLTHRFALPENARFAGVLSRFSKEYVVDFPANLEKYELVMIASGPEPQLSFFCHLLANQAINVRCKAILITGLCRDKDIYRLSAPATLTIVPHLAPDQFLATLLHAGTIICRAGYSTIMDLTVIGRSAVLVPTPGQPEQEYLADYLAGKGLFKKTLQDSLDLGRILDQEGLSGSKFLAHSGNRNI